MKAVALGGNIAGNVIAPTSKSAMQRYIAAALLAEGRSEISAHSMCDDSEAALGIAKALGAEVEISGSTVRIKGGLNPAVNSIFCGESGLSARMFTPIAALHSREISLNGKGSILKRPLDMVEKPLSMLGVKVTSNNGLLPLTVKGPLKGGEVFADGSLSSQFITGLLMALPVAENDSSLTVSDLVSRPYIDLTLSVLNEFGIKVVNNNYRNFVIRGRQKYNPGSYIAEGDWSGAAFLMVLAAIGGEAEISGLNSSSTQADKAVLDALMASGADVSHSGDSYKIKGGKLRSFEFNVSECPDLAPPLAVLALACPGTSLLKGTQRLAAKESDRGKALEMTLSGIGGKLVNHGSYIEIHGGTRLKGGAASSFNDHRIAMALAVASVLSDNEVVIEGFESINKSYPGFAEDFKGLGGRIETE